jgi:hypothetical protein
LSNISSIVERLKAHETRKEERRVLQMKTARERTAKMKEKEKEKSVQVTKKRRVRLEARKRSQLLRLETSGHQTKLRRRMPKNLASIRIPMGQKTPHRDQISLELETKQR